MWRQDPHRAVYQWLIDGVPVAETSYLMLLNLPRPVMHRWMAVIEAGLPPDTPLPAAQGDR